VKRRKDPCPTCRATGYLTRRINKRQNREWVSVLESYTCPVCKGKKEL
jgi:DnaJ-class molecular chaperone